MSNQVKIMALLAARPGKADELRSLLDEMVTASRAEPGNLRYDLWQDRAETTRFALDELYINDNAVTAHRATPHFQTYLARINDLAERHAVVLDAVEVY